MTMFFMLFFVNFTELGAFTRIWALVELIVGGYAATIMPWPCTLWTSKALPSVFVLKFLLAPMLILGVLGYYFSLICCKEKLPACLFFENTTLRLLFLESLFLLSYGAYWEELTVLIGDWLSLKSFWSTWN